MMINAMETKEAAAPPATAGNQLLDDSSRKDSEGNPKSPDVPILKNSIFGFQGGAPTSNLSFEVNDVLDYEQWRNSIISGWSASLNNSIESTEDARAEPEVISESSECVLSPGRRGGGGGATVVTTVLDETTILMGSGSGPTDLQMRKIVRNSGCNACFLHTLNCHCHSERSGW